jgi:hypothetical protein
VASTLSPTLSKTTGNQSLDFAFNNEYDVLIRVFGVRPSFFIMDDSDGPNAFAVPESIQPGSFQGSVLFGNHLMTEEFRSSPLNFTIPAIMAHEFGHAYQFARGGPLPSTKLMELQADYLSGWYMKHRDAQSGWSEQSLRQTLYAFYSKGDYEFNSPRHHGTPDERLQAAVGGVRDQSSYPAAAYQNSLGFIKRFGDSGQHNSDEDPAAQGQRPMGGRAAEAERTDAELVGKLRRILQGVRDEFRALRGTDVGDGSWTSTIQLFSEKRDSLISKNDDGGIMFTARNKGGRDDFDRVFLALRAIDPSCKVTAEGEDHTTATCSSFEGELSLDKARDHRPGGGSLGFKELWLHVEARR